jgi:intraflagellar transport protein 122
LNGNTSKLVTEKSLKYYPLSINFSGNLIAKSSYLVSVHADMYYNCLLKMIYVSQSISMLCAISQAISGSNCKVTLYSKEGAKLSEVCLKESWVWCAACHGDSDLLALGTHQGAIELLRMNFDAVHALYRDRYAFRENLTEVIVHHLVTDKKVRIKCKDLIRNLALYKNKLAVQLSDRVCVYESSADDSIDMHFRLRKEKIVIKDRREESAVPDKTSATGLSNKTNLLAITSLHLVFCTGKVLELYTLDGLRQKVWVLESPANFLSVDGGPDGKEGLLLGLQSGAVIKVFVDNPFPLELTKRATPVVQLDINIYRTILASVDSEGVLAVTDLRTQEVLFTAPGVASACFNTEVEDLICITSVGGSISVLSGARSLASSSSSSGGGEDGMAGAGAGGAYPHSRSAASLPELQEQHIFGHALGFRGQKIFCLHKGAILGVDVPQSANMQRALDAGDILAAYKVACLGATEADWKLLAMRSLRANYLHVAKNAFARLKDTKFLSLVDTIERRGGNSTASAAAAVAATSAGNRSAATGGAAGTGRVRGGTGAGGASAAPSSSSSSSSSSAAGGGGQLPVVPPLDPMWLAELLAYEGHHQEAAKVFARSGKLQEAIRLFTDLRRWEDAKMFARNAGQLDVSDLILQQAKWLQEINDWKGAAELFTSMGQFTAAAKIIGDNAEEGWEDALIEVVRACPVEDAETLDYSGDRFTALEDLSYAKETFTKSKNVSKLMALYAKRQMWNNAAKLAEENEGKFDVSVFLPYAEWLVSQDRYEEAMQAFKKSKRIDLAKKVLEELTGNAVTECRFKDAAYYFWMLSKETESELQQQQEQQQAESGAGAEPTTMVSKAKLQQQAQLQYEYELKADLYFAYANVHSFVTDPFTSQQPEMLFQVARFIINSLGNSETIPAGISKASTLYTLARQSMQLGAFKLARHAYDRLSKLQLAERRQEEVELEMLLVQAKPVRDDPDHLPVCYRCSSTNPLLNPFTNKFAKGDVCTNCGHPFVRSFINFDVLPLVEFVPDPSISDEEAIELIRQPPSASSAAAAAAAGVAGSKVGARGGGPKQVGGWKESKSGGADMMTFDGEGGGSGSGAAKRMGGGRGSELDEVDAMHEAMGVNVGESDLFTRCLNLTLEKQVYIHVCVCVCE